MKPIEVKTVYVNPVITRPEPINVNKINVRYDDGQDVYLMDSQSFTNLNIFLIDVEKYIKECNSIFDSIDPSYNK